MSKQVKESVNHRTGVATRTTIQDFGNGNRKIDVVKIMPDGIWGSRVLGSQKRVKSISQSRSK